MDRSTPVQGRKQSDDQDSLLRHGDSRSSNGSLGVTPSVNTSVRSSDAANIKIFTLNCWGLKYISKLRLERFKAIAEFLSRSSYDVVFLQEVWINSDYEDFAKRLEGKFPFSHYFDHGIIGSGTCIFSTVRLQEANFHEFTINGYPTNFWHGDWFAAKGIGVCRINYKGFDVHLYVSHYHANYSPEKDTYLSHRVNHALESGQWIKLASSAADLTVYAGDFNCEPTSLPYRLLRSVAPLADSWEVLNGECDGGETSETLTNSFNVTRAGAGNRIDFIMYSRGPDVDCKAVDCKLPLPNRIPGQAYSYSDHEGVEATISLKRRSSAVQAAKGISQAASFRRLESEKLREGCVRCVSEAIAVVDRALKCVDDAQSRYMLLIILLFALLLATFTPALMLDGRWNFIAADVGMFIPRFVCTAAIVVFALMGSLFSKRERNALVGTKKQLKMLLEQDLL